MALYSIEQKWLGLGKETTRGTAVAPTRFIPVEAGSEAEYKLNLIEDETVRGIFEKFPPKAGTKEGTFSISGIEGDVNNIGELIYSLLGDVTTTQLDTDAYQHVFKRSNSITLPSYTITIHRGINAKRYPLSVVKSLVFTQGVDAKLKIDASGIFKTEEDYSSPPTPTWSELKTMMFYNNIFKIDGTQNTMVREWSVTIDNGSVGIRALNNTQDIVDVISHAKLVTTGSFVIFFENETQRQKFLNNTSADVEILVEGEQLTTGHNYTLKIKLPQIHYTAYPFGEVEGLLGASVSFNVYYNLTAQNSVEITLKNNINGY